MNIPNTYAEWVECFDLLKTGTQDADVLHCMKQGSLVLSPGVAGRFAEQINTVIQHRVTKLSDKFNRAIQVNGGDLDLLNISLLRMRKEFMFLIQFASMPILAPGHTELLIDAITEQAATMQKSLEDSASKIDRTGAMASIIRKTRIDKLEGR